MLVLTRKNHEKIRIGDDVIITILRLKGSTVRLGIDAPKEVPVLRGELVFDVSADDEPSSTAKQTRGSGATNSDEKDSGGGKESEIRDRWSGAMNPRSEFDERNSADRPQNCFQHRVPRELRANIVPQLVSARGPLRDMLDRRAVVR